MAPSDVADAPTIAERVENMSPAEFVTYQRDKWNAVEKRLIQPLLEGVTEGDFSPMEAAKLTSCVTGEIFGYSEFHGSVLGAPANDLLNAVIHRTKDYR